MCNSYRCLICNDLVDSDGVEAHRINFHSDCKEYGIMWPNSDQVESVRCLRPAPIYESEYLASQLGVKKVYIRDEGQNISGSMKDYGVEFLVRSGKRAGYEYFTVVSSGNQAVSLAKYTQSFGCRAVVFTPAGSSKIDYLASMENTIVFGVEDAIFEDVYSLAAGINIAGVYNTNVNNKLWLSGFTTVSDEVMALDPLPTHILAGVGNGSYLAGIALGFCVKAAKCPKIVPVGMKGAFPTESALQKKRMIEEYHDFFADLCEIDAAEGSIAIASYSMPQLIHAINISNGFTLGDLDNNDLKEAYKVLSMDPCLVDHGAIPEPTGIMGLASAIKHCNQFGLNDVLLISFTGHAVKDLEGLERLTGGIGQNLVSLAKNNRQDLLENNLANRPRKYIINRQIGMLGLEAMVTDILKEWD